MCTSNLLWMQRIITASDTVNKVCCEEPLLFKIRLQVIPSSIIAADNSNKHHRQSRGCNISIHLIVQWMTTGYKKTQVCSKTKQEKIESTSYLTHNGNRQSMALRQLVHILYLQLYLMPLITETVFHNLATKTSAENKLPPLNTIESSMHIFSILFTLSCIPLTRAENCTLSFLGESAYTFQKSLNAYSRAEWLKRVHTFPWKNCLLIICAVKTRV